MKYFLTIAITLLLLSFSVPSSVEPCPSGPERRRYEAIFNFGDSLSDTGNTPLPFPYGRTFPGHPTGRCSDGRLIIDFIAEALGLPYLEGYRKNKTSQHGVNFAFAGSTVLDVKYYTDRRYTPYANNSLSDQLVWFKKLKPSLCTTQQECKEVFKKSLFIVGEMGGNDYFHIMKKELVPLVIDTIHRAAETLIEEGAMDLMFPGILPAGCVPSALKSSNKSLYDRYGCAKGENEIMRYHNMKLQTALQKLRQKYPHTRIIYADYYNAAMPLFKRPQYYGFKEAFRACCGGGGPHNYNVKIRCGKAGYNVCSDPSSYISWDGGHFTEAAYRHMALGLISGRYTSETLLC